MRRPLPGSNYKAFEPPLQPVALLTQQAAVRAQRAAMAAKADRLRLQRTYLERQQQGQGQQGGGVAGPEHAQQEYQQDQQPAVQPQLQSALDNPSQALPLQQALAGVQAPQEGQQRSSPGAAGERERGEAWLEAQGT